MDPELVDLNWIEYLIKKAKDDVPEYRGHKNFFHYLLVMIQQIHADKDACGFCTSRLECQVVSKIAKYLEECERHG